MKKSVIFILGGIVVVCLLLVGYAAFFVETPPAEPKSSIDRSKKIYNEPNPTVSAQQKQGDKQTGSKDAGTGKKQEEDATKKQDDTAQKPVKTPTNYNLNGAVADTGKWESNVQKVTKNSISSIQIRDMKNQQTISTITNKNALARYQKLFKTIKVKANKSYENKSENPPGCFVTLDSGETVFMGMFGSGVIRFYDGSAGDKDNTLSVTNYRVLMKEISYLF